MNFRDDKVFLIGEIGINHNGNLQIAKRLIDAAFACGWDCVKFQKRTPEICVPEHQKQVVRDTPWGKMSYIDYRHRVEFGKDEYSYIDTYCKEKPIRWTASVWDTKSLGFLLQFDVPFIKVPSAKLTDMPLLHAVAISGKPIILSTGMSTLDEIDRAVDVLEEYSGNFALMHTNSTYPTPVDELNLRIIPVLRERYNCAVGYSGHEFGLEPTVIAVSLGANIIERHITLDHTMWGSDHSASLEVHAMDMLKKRIGEVRLSLGSGEKVVTKNEIIIREKLRGKER